MNLIKEIRVEKKSKIQPLSHSHDFLDSLIENLPLMIFVKEAKDLRFVRFNRAGEELLGISRSELIGKNDFDFFPKEQAEFFVAKDRAVLRGREILDIPEEPIMTRRQGGRVLHTRKIPLIGADGQPEYLLGISEDITDQSKAEDTRRRMILEEAILKEREASAVRAAILADASSAIIRTLDYQQSLKALANVLVPALGEGCAISIRKEDGSLERVVVLGNGFDRTMEPKLRAMNPIHEKGAAGVAHLFATGQSQVFSPLSDEQLRSITATEEHFNVAKSLEIKHLMLMPLIAHDRVFGAINLFRCGSKPFSAEDKELAEEIGRRAGINLENCFLYEGAQRAIDLRDQFLSIASHELKTPLTSLRLQIDLAEKSGAASLRLDRLSKQVDRLTRLIEDLLDVTRIQSGKINYKLESVNLSELVSETVERMANSLAAVNCQLQTWIDPNLIVRADPGRIEQVLVNLLSNAIKYAPGSPVEVRLFDAGKGMLAIEVKDRGPGISQEKLGLIFDRFERAGMSRNIGGLGLGLFIAKQITEAHGGQIQAESSPGLGAKFTVRIPKAGPGKTRD